MPEIATPTLPSIERRIALRASPARVWTALTDELGTWFADRAELDLRPGGAGWLEWDAYGRFPIVVEAADPERRLAWRGRPGDADPTDFEQTTLTEWILEPAAGGGTTLTVRETGFRRPDARLGNVAGWFVQLRALMEHVASEPWDRPIHRTLHLRADPARVWQALTDRDAFRAWWGSSTDVERAPGSEGWFSFPEHGRRAVRIEAVDAPVYLAWRWNAASQEPLADAGEVLLTEWLLQPRDDGGTDLHLVESGFRGPGSFGDNSGGWDDEVLPLLVKVVDG